MKYEHFVRLVQNLAELPTADDAISIIRVTLETLTDRLPPDVADRVAKELPEEIGNFMRNRGEPQTEFSLEEFFKRVQQRASLNVADSVHQVRAVTEVLRESISPNELENMYANLPEDFRQLFDAGPSNDSSTSEVS